ncbi:MAG: 23S rRNA (cytidine(2498)-2'-O)-methyltransferase RlmM [Deltaproteobacteria bacterium]|nr:23S rRNA (cytidine(2498)-2'-O)-methyltransferase RlmM [Deltaproteobacteria bacterium]
MKHLILYCRAGFEKECAAEISAAAASAGLNGYVKAKPESGHVIFTLNEKGGLSPSFGISFSSLIFCRQIFAAFDEVTDLPPHDRVSPCIKALKPHGISVDEVVVETADTDESKQILPFCRSFGHHFQKAMVKEGMLIPEKGKRKTGLRLHLFFLNSDRVYMGISEIDNSSPFYMGIPRLKFPKEAPSRSTLKLEEAFFVFLSQHERDKYLKQGMTAVDLGASPGGWSYQFVRRNIYVTAIDNGPMDNSLIQSGLINHIKTDGFSYVPKGLSDWMVCDIVEQPIRIARLVGKWINEGWCRHTIFNLKLPMKKRYQEVKACEGAIRKMLDGSGKRYSLSIKQLYHDREEVTGFITTG